MTGKRKLGYDELPELSLTVKLIVFDFDQTITKEHTVGDEKQLKSDMRNNIYRQAEMKEVFWGLHEAGYILCVASFAKKERIIDYLDALLEDERLGLFKDEDIYGNNDVDGATKDRYDASGVLIKTARNLKIDWLAEICDKYNVKPEQLLLVDDGARNLTDASKADYQTLDGSSLSSPSSSSSRDKEHFIDVFKSWVVMDERLKSGPSLFSSRIGLSCSSDVVPRLDSNSRQALKASM